MKTSGLLSGTNGSSDGGRTPIVRRALIVCSFVFGVAPSALGLGQLLASERQVVQGITVSTHRGGQEWGSDEIGPTFSDLVEIGANWVAIHPYARIDSGGNLSWAAIDPNDPPLISRDRFGKRTPEGSRS